MTQPELTSGPAVRLPGWPPAAPAAPAARAGLPAAAGPARPDGLAALAGLVASGGVVVLSGAGISTESGIPDYRGPTGRTRRAQPMMYQAFLAEPAARQRYWARSQLGWRHIALARPNAGHAAVARLERAGLVTAIITQNVDGLHQAAGARRVVELHGRLSQVRCLGCGQRTSRMLLDRRLRAANPGWEAAAVQVNPDGDAVLTERQTARFRVVDCAECGGVLKPDVVFFGENVPPSRVAECSALLGQASTLLVLGSSLTVMSGYRFVCQAARRSIPVAIVNQGPTRGDQQASLVIDAPLGQTLAWVVTRLDLA